MCCIHDRNNEQFTISQNTIRNSISIFFKKKIFLRWVSVLSFDRIFTSVGSILKKQYALQYIRNSIKLFINKENSLIFILQYYRTFHTCIIYYCRTDIDEARCFFSDYGHKLQGKFQFDLFLKRKSNFWVSML